MIELKMCGVTYSAGYAAQGIEQLAHYMDSKESHIGHLIVFDARRRDFGKGMGPQAKRGAHQIAVRFVDIRPDVVAGRTQRGRKRGSSPERSAIEAV